jgi:hypothetical protein
MPNKQISMRPIARSAWHPAFGIVATALALTACYGTLALVSVLSLVGVTVEIENGLWAAAIVAFFGLAVGLIAFRNAGAYGPTLLGVLGFGLIFWVMFGVYSWTTELTAFAILVTATFWNRLVQKTHAQ